ncbi:hypothetical protein Salat_2379400 [Sesamum alatum]|uniref:Reverse transcriptase n=1 Tax=Sesamum alatum TaxID=300844 RepID=A0AAE1XX68_9LAMI|nr:hypothetical protein Salat_2379400 [Sesamum alatum]
MWARHPDFLATVQSNWGFPTGCHGKAGLSAKLKRLKHKLRVWNKEVFGNIFDNLREAEAAAAIAKRIYDAAPSETNRAMMNRCTTQLQHALSIEEDFWRQKAA